MPDEPSGAQSRPVPADPTKGIPPTVGGEKPVSGVHPMTTTASATLSGKRKRRTKQTRILVGAGIVCVVLVGAIVYLNQLIQQTGTHTTPGPEAGQPGAVGGTPTPQAVGTQPGPGPAMAQGTGGTTSAGQSQGAQPQTQEPEGPAGDLTSEEEKSLQEDLAYKRNQIEQLEKELADRDTRMDAQRAEAKKSEERLARVESDREKQAAEFAKREQALTTEMNQVREEMVKLQSALEESRAALAELKEKFSLKERQYQTEVAALQTSLDRSQERGTELLSAIEEQKIQIHALEEKLSARLEEQASQHLEKARELIQLLDSRGGGQQEKYLQEALQHLFVAGKVDPKNHLKYRQMALELVDEQMDKLRQDKGLRAEGDKRMKLYRQLRAELEGA